LILAGLCTLCAQAAVPVVGADNYVARAKQFLGTLYPGLDDLLRVVIVGDRLRDPAISKPDVMNLFTMELRGPEPKWGQAPAAPGSPDPVLRAFFVFDWQTENKELIDLTVSGPFARGRGEEFAKEVSKHPEWSDAKITVALSEAGAKYGPDHKAEFLNALPLEKLRPFMGGAIDVESAELSVVRLGASKPASLAWWVRAKWYSPNGRVADCFLTFEPFDGILESISRGALTHNAEGGPRSGLKRKAP